MLLSIIKKSTGSHCTFMPLRAFDSLILSPSIIDWRKPHKFCKKDLKSYLTATSYSKIHTYIHN